MKPTALPVRVDGIAEALTRERRWVCWRYILRDDDWTKVPFQPSGRVAKTNDPSTWSTFEAVLAAYATGRFDGIGFALGDGWAGIDLDDCVTDYNPTTGSLWATTDAVGPFVMALDESNAPWEISPSGTGYKLIGRSPRVGGEVKFKTDPPTFTTWTQARYFCITGHFQSCSSDATVDISGLIDRWFPPAPAVSLSSTRDGYALAAEATDRDLLITMFANDKNGDAILALYQGNTSGYLTHSEADLALCCHLAWWTNFDVNRVDRLFQQSTLCRPEKWKRDSYRLRTLKKAVARPVDVVVGEIAYE